MRGVLRTAVAVLVLAVLAGAGYAAEATKDEGTKDEGTQGAATQKEPDGVLNLKFGMAPEFIKKLYPNAVEEPVPTPAAGEPVPPFKLPRYTIKGQTVGPLQNCTLSANLFNDYLYQVQVSCPEDKAKIEAYLEKEYGPPGHDQKPIKSWTGENTSVSYTSASGMFMVEDKKYSQSVSLTIMHYALSHGLSGKPAAKAGAPANPAGATGEPKTEK